MRALILSDIHANLEALQAVLAATAGEYDELWNLGDLVGYASQPNEVVALLGDRNIHGISGNYDSTVASGYKHCGCRSESPRQEELSHISFEWTLKNTSPETKKVLARLPFRLDLRPLGGHVAGPTVTLVHATPDSNLVYVTDDRPDDFLRKMASRAGRKSGDAICFGHTHKPWHREVDGVQFINTGSVGRPKDGDWRAGYIILDIGENAPKVEFVRVSYDVDAAVRGIEKVELPDDFSFVLRNGRDS